MPKKPISQKKSKSVQNNQEKVLAAILAGATRKEAARLAGLSEYTVYRYLKDPEFMARLDEARAEAVKASKKDLVVVYTKGNRLAEELVEKGVVALGALMELPPKPNMAKVVALKSVVEMGHKTWAKMVDTLLPTEKGQGSGPGGESPMDRPAAPLPREGTEEHPLSKAGRSRVSNVFQRWVSQALNGVKPEISDGVEGA